MLKGKVIPVSSPGTVPETGLPKGPVERPRATTPRTPKKRAVWLPKNLMRILGILAVLVLAVFGYRYFHTDRSEKPDVKTALVERGDVKSTVSATGTLQPFTQVDVKSKAGGLVLKMLVDEGTRVKKGQLICYIDPTDNKSAYDQAEADVRTAQSALVQSRKTQQFLDTTLGPQVQQAGQAVTAARVKLAQARDTLTLQKQTNGPAIQGAVDAVTSAQAKLYQAREALALQRQTAETDITNAKGGVASAQAKLQESQQSSQVQPDLTNAAIAQAQAGVDAAQANVASTEQDLQLLQSATQPQDVAAAQAAVDEANSNVTVNQTNLTRQQNLLAKGFVPASTVDTAKNQLDLATAALHSAQAKLDTIKSQQTAQLQSQQAKVTQAKGALNQAQAALHNAQVNSVQNTLKEQDVVASQAALRQAQSVLAAALANRKQIALKQADVESAVAALRQSQATLTSTNANSRQITLRAEDVDAAIAAVGQSEAALNTTRDNSISNASKAEDIAQNQAKLIKAVLAANNAKTNLEQTTVVAPSSGIITKKYVDVGTIIQSGVSGFSAGTAIVQLSDTSTMYVDTTVDEASIAAIEPGQDVDITLDAYPNSPKSGKVLRVYPVTDVVSNVTYIHVQVKIDEADVDERLRSGMNATCDFLVDHKENVLTVPTEAVKDTGDTSEVTVIKDPKQPLWDEKNQDKRTVEVGLRGDDSTEILSGLKEGDTVVTQITQPVTAVSAGSTGAGGGAPRGPTGGMGGGGGGGGRRG